MKKRHPLRATWYSMIYRCYKESNLNYQWYGARGITVCERWRTFENFASDMGDRPPGLTMDRRDNDGPYCPENCYWATKTQQMRNRRNAIKLVFGKEVHLLIDISNKTGIHPNTIMQRYEKGLPFHEVIQSERIKRDPESFKPWGQAGTKARTAQMKAMTHCVNGHEFTPENTAIVSGYKRRCRECHRSKMRHYAARKRGEE